MDDDKYQRLRDALAAGPTPGGWMSSGEVNGPGESLFVATMAYSGNKRRIIARVKNIISGRPLEAEDFANAAYIAAADPGTIRALLAERDALREALIVAREYVANEIAYMRNAFRGHEELGKVPEAEADLARIDAALGDTNAHP